MDVGVEAATALLVERPGLDGIRLLTDCHGGQRLIAEIDAQHERGFENCRARLGLRARRAHVLRFNVGRYEKTALLVPGTTGPLVQETGSTGHL